MLLIFFKFRSGLFEIPESDREPRSSSDPRSLSSTPVSFLRFQSRIGSGEKNNLSKSQEDDVYSDLPIGTPKAIRLKLFK